MRRMTRRTAFDFQRRVLEHEWPLLVCMALDATSISSGCKSGLLQLKATVRIVAVAAFHHSFEDFVMERLVEVRLDFVVTAQAKLRLAKLQQMDG